MINILEPRYHDRKVLIATYKVEPMMNLINIVKGAYKGFYRAPGKDIKSCTVDDNGKISCYAVPIEKLERL